MRYEVPAEPEIGARVRTPKREYVRTDIGWEDAAPGRPRQGFQWHSLVLRYPLTLDDRPIVLPEEPPVGSTLRSKGQTFTRYTDGWADDPGMMRRQWPVLLADMGPLSDEP
jgi:hypothetical protein